MNLLNQKAVLIDLNFNKYGWTNNCKARFFFEKMHNTNIMLDIISKDQKAYIYMLKRFIVTKRNNMFRKLFPIYYMKSLNEEFMQFLLWYTIKYNNYPLFNYLISNYNFTYVNNMIINKINKLTEYAMNKYLNKLYNKIMINILPNVNLSTLDNAYAISIYEDNIFMKYMIIRLLDNFSLLSDIKYQHMNLKDFLKYFNYEKTI